jgi:multiple sugar transport system permease protein
MAKETLRQREIRTGWLLIIPALIVLILVFAYPIGRAFYLSVFTRNLGTELQSVFSGFDNYARLIGDGRFWQSMWQTTIFTVSSLLLELVFGMAIALVLNQAFFGRGLVRTSALIPWALPTAVMGLAWA